MTKTIKDKTYDPSTATRIANYNNRLPPRDTAYLNETLYQSKTGELFLCGKGGLETKYGKGTIRLLGQADIVPLSQREALDWWSRHFR